MLTQAFEVADERFARLAMGNVHLETLYTGCRWAEGPAYFAAGRYLVWSDIPNDRMLRWDETDGSVSVFRARQQYERPQRGPRGPAGLGRASRALRVAHRA
jgi:gluconolactonase